MNRWEHSNLTDNFEVRGHWWAPGNEAQRVPGILTRTVDQTTLFIFGRLGMMPDMNRIERGKQPGKIPIIHGVDLDGTLLTLYDSHAGATTMSIGAPGAGSEEYHPDFTIAGGHFDKPEALVFTGMKFGTTNLENWVGYSPFGEMKTGDETDPLSFVLTGRNMDPVHVDVPSLDARFSITWRMMNKGGGFRSKTLTQTMFLEIKPTDPKPLAWFMQQLGAIQNLITLLVGHPVYLRDVLMFGEEKQITPSYSATAEFPLFFSPARQPDKNEKELTQGSILLGYQSIQSMIFELLHNWFTFSDKFKEVVALYFSTIFNRGMTLESRFLNLVQALERYSRVLKLPTPVTPKAKISLQQRLEAILDTLQQQSLLLFSFKKTVFAERVAGLRNYLSHYSDDLKHYDLDGIKLYALCERLKVFLTIILLKDIGVPEEAVHKVLSEDNLLLQFRHIHFDDSI